MVTTIPNQRPQPTTPGLADYKVRLKDQDGVAVAEFDNWESLVFTHKVNFPSSCRFQMDAGDERTELFELDGQIEVWRRNLAVSLNWYVEWEGFHRTQNDLVEVKDNQFFVSYSPGYLSLLARRFIMYFAGTSETDKSDIGETVLKEFVNENAGPSALSANGRLGGVDGNFTGLTIEADAGNGTTWEGTRAFRNLLVVCQDIANETGVDFDIVGTGPATYEFRVFDGQRGEDRSTIGLGADGLNGAGNAPVIFSLDFGNMAVPILSVNRSKEANAIYVLGQGQEAARSVVLREDTVAIADSPWNRIEFVRNATQETATAGLNSVGDETLVEKQKIETLNFTALQLQGTYYGEDYHWGDLVTARFREQEFNKKIIGARITVSDAVGGEQIKLEFADIP